MDIRPTDLQRRPPRFIVLLVAVLAFGSVQSGLAARPADPGPPLKAADLEHRIHVLINEQRRKHGLNALGWSDALARIALGHSRDMAERNYLGHDTPSGETPEDRYRKGRFNCAVPYGQRTYTGAENVAMTRLYNHWSTSSNGSTHYDWNSAEQIARNTVDNWMHSRGHRENILEPFWRQQGIGVEIGPGNKVLVTQNFC